MSVAKTLLLFVVAAVAEIGGAWLIWQGVREHRGLVWIGAGIAALAAYGFVATWQDDPHFGRVLAAYGGIFVAGSLAWGSSPIGSGPIASTSSAPRCAWSVWPSSCSPRAEIGPFPFDRASGRRHTARLSTRRRRVAVARPLHRRGAETRRGMAPKKSPRPVERATAKKQAGGTDSDAAHELPHPGCREPGRRGRR